MNLKPNEQVFILKLSEIILDHLQIPQVENYQQMKKKKKDIYQNNMLLRCKMSYASQPILNYIIS